MLFSAYGFIHTGFSQTDEGRTYFPFFNLYIFHICIRFRMKSPFKHTLAIFASNTDTALPTW